MKTNPLTSMPLALLLMSATLTSQPLKAATIIELPGDAGSAPGITYERRVEMSDQDTGTWLRHVGARSWNETNNPDGLKGWTHTSDWAALNLLKPAVVTIELARKLNVPTSTGVAGNDFYPAFSLYTGWQNDGDEEHQYNNQGNTFWAEDIFYLAHEGNNTATSVSRSFLLPAGLYSLAIGSNPPASLTVLDLRQGYSITLSSTPVPESTTSVGLVLTLLGLIGSRSLRR